MMGKKFKKTKLYKVSFMITMEWNYKPIKKKTRKFTYMQKLNHRLFNNKWVKDEITREFRKHSETNKNE